MIRTTLVLGATENTSRYANMAIRKLRSNNFPVIAVGLREGQVLDVPIQVNFPTDTSVHTVTLYLNKQRQKEYYNTILALKPQRVIFNPGTENEEFEALLKEHGIAVEEACTLVLLSTNQYE